MNTPEKITVSTTIEVPADKVWEYFNTPEHVTKWNFASDDWHAPAAVNELRPGGTFSYRMEAKDGSFGFDFAGTYDAVEAPKHVSFTLGDGRKVSVDFTAAGKATEITETFEAENVNPLELQKGGWQSILDNFKKYTESN